MNSNANNKKPEELIVEFFSRVWGPSHDLKAIDEMMTEDYVIITGGKEIKGRENFKNRVKQFQQLLLNARTISQEAFANAEGTRVVSRWICTGDNNGIFDLPADGKEVSFTGIAIWEIKNGKLATCWVERSALELYKTLTGS